VRGGRALLACAVALGGCVTVDATLRADGSARLVMLYRTPPEATEFLERRRFASPNVTVESVKIFEDRTTVVRATVRDVGRLGTSPGFGLVDVAREQKRGDEELTVTLRNPRPVAGKADGRPFFTLSVTLPGPVRRASHHAAFLGSRVTWEVSRREYGGSAEVPLRVRYRPPPR
jgi:hypothetical protein